MAIVIKNNKREREMMFHTSQEVIQWIQSQINQGMKLGLERMEWFMEKLDHPERTVRAVHVGGTNGKGSTVTFLRSILQTAGYEVGTYTSPYIETFEERISINGEPIPEADLVQVANLIKPLADELAETELGAPTEFELLTAIAIYYFGKLHKVDITIVEVGLGGKNDATNVIIPFISIITNIGYDHMNVLGDTIVEIATEKAGIIKNGAPVITAVSDLEALTIIEEAARRKRSTVYKLDREFSYTDLGPSDDSEFFSVKTTYHTYPVLTTTMLGKHQIENATLAIMAAEYLKQFYALYIEEEHIQAGVKNAFWPGRFEVNGQIILDGSHNEEGIKSLVDTLERHYSNKKLTILFTALEDKPLEKMINTLDALHAKLYFTELSQPRAAKAEQLFELSNAKQKEIVINWQSFMTEKQKEMREDELLVICGSLYFIKEVISILK